MAKTSTKATVIKGMNGGEVHIELIGDPTVRSQIKALLRNHLALNLYRVDQGKATEFGIVCAKGH